MSSHNEVVITHRFHGPSGSGNGGYTCGLTARLAGGGTRPLTVTLRVPPPLDTPLYVDSSGSAGTVRLTRDDVVVADCVPGEFADDPVPAVSAEQAMAAEPQYRGRVNHPFPTCFVCGTDRADGDGLRLAPGLHAPGRTACLWTPDRSLATEPGSPYAASEFAWAALDCPGGWTSDLEARPLVLGRMTALCEEPPLIGRPHVIVGEHRRTEGRKTFTATTLYDEDGRVLGRAEHIWFAVDPAAFQA